MDSSSSMHPSKSTVSLADSVTSTAPLVRPKKDFEATFAGLQATYGTTGGIPAPPDKKNSAHKQKAPTDASSKSIADSTLPVLTSSDDAISPSETIPKARDLKPKYSFSLFSTKKK